MILSAGAVAVAVAAGLGLGAAVALGLPLTYLIAGLLIPFSVILMLARPHWAAVVYAVLVYTDLLSILVKYHGMPSLARFVGWALFGAVLGYRLLVRREGLVTDRATLWLALYGGMVALGLVYARSPDLVLPNVIEFTRIFLAYLIIINTLTTVARLRVTLWCLLGAGVLFASLTIFQSLTQQYENDFGGLAQFRVSEITGTNDAPRPGGTLGDANYYGQSLLIILPIALYLLAEGRKRFARLAGWVAALLLVVAIVFTYSRGDAVALGTILVAAVVYKRPNPIYLLGGLIALVIALPILPNNYVSRLTTLVDIAGSNRQAILSEDSVRGRAGATQAAIEMFLDHPIIGVGRENYPSYQLEYLAGTSLAKSARGIPPHNLYLEVAAEHGLLGIIVVGGLLLVTLRALFEARRRFRDAGDHTHSELASWLAIGLLGYLVSALFLHGAHIWMLGLQVALIVSLRQLSRVASPDFVSPQLPVLGTDTAWQDIASRETLITTVLSPALEQAGPKSIASSKRRERWGGMRSVFSGKRSLSREDQRATPPATEDMRYKLWLDAAEGARLQGDLMTARSLVDAVLKRAPQHEIALQMDARLQPPTPAPQESAKTVTLRTQDVSLPKTYKVASPFRDYWRQHGGASAFGPPISAPFVEPTPEGRPQVVQYFTRARLEHHPEWQGTQNEVSLGNLGLELEIGSALAASPLPEALGGQQVSLVPGGITTPWKFSVFWHLNGGGVMLGRPITPVLVETGQDGARKVVQYFERTRLEHHSDRVGTVDEVRLGDLGSEVFERRYGGKRYVH